MRRFVLATAMVGMAFGAEAADLSDLPVLRGSLPPSGLTIQKANWDGWYVGGQASYSAMEADFGKSIPLLGNLNPSTGFLPQPSSQFSMITKTTIQGPGFGGFAGRNWQWDDIVVGLEANYNYFNSLSTSATGYNTRVTVDPVWQVNPPNTSTTYTVTSAGRVAVQLHDAIQLRARTGFAVGNFLPYVFGAAVLGRVDVSRTVTSTVTSRADTTIGAVVTRGPTVDVPALTQILFEQKTNQLVGGWSGGLGLEYCVWGGLFTRAEWDYTKFIAVKNTVVQANNFRFGLGYKF